MSPWIATIICAFVGHRTKEIGRRFGSFIFYKDCEIVTYECTMCKEQFDIWTVAMNFEIREKNESQETAA